MLARQDKSNELLGILVEKGITMPVNSVNFTDLPKPEPKKRVSNKMQKSIEWLKDNPEKREMTSRDIADILGVSHTTVAKAKQIIDESNNDVV